MALGIITGQKIGKNKDGDVNRILLQVEMMTDDVRTIELFTQAGEDTNPGNGCRVNIVPVSSSYQIAVGISDDLESECDPGEKEIYSTDSPVTAKKARILLNKDSEIILNQGTDTAVRFSELKKVIDELQDDISDLKNAFTSWVVAPMDGGAALKAAAATWAATPFVENIDNSEVEDVFLP